MRTKVALLLAWTASLSTLMLVGTACYAVIANTVDWTTNHPVGGPKIAPLLAGLLGSVVTAVIAGTVGWLGKHDKDGK